MTTTPTAEREPERAKVRTYGQSFNPQAENPTRCVASVHDRLRWASFQCQRQRGHGPDGLYCKQHDPAAQKARDAAATERHHADMKKLRFGWVGVPLARALFEIANGHNDPRTLAHEVLKSAGIEEAP